MSREQALRDFFAYTYLKVSRYTRKKYSIITRNVSQKLLKERTRMPQ